MRKRKWLDFSASFRDADGSMTFLPPMNSLRRLTSLLVAVTFTTLSLSTAFGEPPPLSSIKAIKSLSVAEAEKQLPVEFEAQLLKVNTGETSTFFFDGAHGIYVVFNGGTQMPRHAKPGEIYRVKGLTNKGLVYPHIDYASVELIGSRPLPEPKRITAADFDDVELDCQWVELFGTITEKDPDWVGRPVALKILCEGKKAHIALSPSVTSEVFVKSISNKYVRIRAIAASRGAPDRSLSVRFFEVANASDITILAPSERSPSPFAELIGNNVALGQFAKVHGVVLHSSGNDLYLREENSNILIKTLTEYDWPPGTIINAQGQVRMAGVSPLLLATEVNKVGEQEVPEPKPFDVNAEIYQQYFDKELISLEASVVTVSQGNGALNILCEEKGKSFNCILLTESSEIPKNLAKGARIGITGICELAAKQFFLPDEIRTNDLSILLRTSDDITIIKPAPWWTTPRILLSLGIVATCTLLAMAWAITLKRRVAHQTSTIGEQIERETTLQERQRIARELHDSLQQNMTGVSMQLDNLEKKLKEEKHDESATSLDLAKRMLNHCQNEARASITELRDSGSGGGSLGSLLEDILQTEAQLAGVKLEIVTRGNSFLLAEGIALHFLRVAREAFSNAIRHAEASTIKIIFSYDEPNLTLTIKDDGLGFDTEQILPPGHFGLIGMKERANKIGANLVICSDSTGTTVEISLE